MQFFIVGLHIVLCFFLILVVLLQPGKGADFGAAMGGTSQDVFGASGSVTLLTKLTAVVAGMFMATSLSLAWFSTNADRDAGIAVEDLIEELGAEATPEPAPDSGSEALTPTEPDPEPSDVAGDDDSAAAPAVEVQTGDSEPVEAPEPADSSSAEPVEIDAAPAAEPAPEAAPAEPAPVEVE
jgi:preprotein translocase subunit SecG